MTRCDVLKVCIAKLKPVFLCLLAVGLLGFDVGSDWWNGLEMAGIINQPDEITSDILHNSTTINPHQTTTLHITTPHNLHLNTTEYIPRQVVEPDVIWGGLTIALTFLPGLVAAVIMTVVFADRDHVLRSFILGFFITLAFTLFYPLICIGCIIFSHVSSDQAVKQIAQQLTANEAFFEAALQLLLQLFIIGSGREPTIITMICIIISFVTLSKKVPDWDLANGCINTDGFCDIILSILTNTPLYGLSIISRLGCLAVILIMFRYWAIIPIIIIPEACRVNLPFLALEINSEHGYVLTVFAFKSASLLSLISLAQLTKQQFCMKLKSQVSTRRVTSNENNIKYLYYDCKSCKLSFG